MSIGKKTVIGFFWSVIEGWGSQAISLIVFFLLARLLSPEAFGLVAMANVFLAFMNVFLDQGFAQALIQRQKLDPEHLDTAFWTNLAIGIILAGLGITGAEIVARWFNQPQLVPILRCLCTLFVITSLSNIHKALLEREFAFKAIARRTLLGLVCGGITGILMALSGFGVWSLVAYQIVNEFMGTLVLWHASSWKPRLVFSKVHFDQLFSFGISLLALQFVNFFNNRGNDFLIGAFLGAEALGYYAIALSIMKAVQQLLMKPANQVALPTFSRLQEDLGKFRNVFYKATQLTGLISFPIFLGLFLLTPELIVILFGEQWRPAIAITQVLCFSGLIQAISSFKGQILVAMGKPEWRLWQSLLSIILSLIGFAIAFQWGIVAIAAAYTIRRYIVFPIGQWAIYLLIHISWRVYLLQFLLPIAASSVMLISMYLTKSIVTSITSSNIAIILSCSLVGFIVYSAVIMLNPPDSLTRIIKDISRNKWA